MHDALRLDEIVALIVAELGHSKASLAALSSTNQQFFQYARAALWRELPGYVPLARLMPEWTWKAVEIESRPGIIVHGLGYYRKAIFIVRCILSLFHLVTLIYAASQEMTEADRIGDWLGDRFKLYAGLIREAYFDNPLRPITETPRGSIPTIIQPSVVSAWNSYASSCLLFPRLSSIRVYAGSALYNELLEDYVSANITLLEAMLIRPLDRIHLRIHDSLTQSAAIRMCKFQLKLFQRLDENQQAVQDFKIEINPRPNNDILKTIGTAVLKMNALKYAVFGINFVDPRRVLYHLAALPYLGSLEFRTMPEGLVDFTHLSSEKYFPLLQTLEMSPKSGTEFTSCVTFLGAFATPNLRNYRINIRYQFSTLEMESLISLAQILAFKSSLLYVEPSVPLVITSHHLQSFRDFVTPFSPLFMASNGAFRLALRDLRVFIPDELAVEFFPLFQFVSWTAQHHIFRARTLLECAKAYPNACQPVDYLGIMLDGDLEREWYKLEPMPLYTHIVVDVWNHRKIDQPTAAFYAPMLRFLFPRLRCLYLPNNIMPPRNIVEALASELGNISCRPLGTSRHFM
jgi:hypothetical protein